MATLEDVRTKEIAALKEAELHNAGIKERYNRLRDAEERQFSQNTQNATDYTVRASVLAPEKPAFSTFENVPQTAQTPQVTQFVRERVVSPVFTTEKFDVLTDAQTTQAPQMVMAPVEIPVTHTAQAVQPQEEQYSLSAFAKKAIAAFCATVTVMMTLIGVNTHLINQKRVEIERLQTEQTQLLKENEEIQRRIREATSEETIREYAQSQGMIKPD
jgi:cell division protein FtsL